MILTLATLETELQSRLKNRTITSAQRIRWLNMAQDDVAIEMECENLKVDPTFSSVVSTKKYYLDVDFNSIISIRDLTNNIDLRYISESDIESMNPDETNEGTPHFFSISGLSWTKAQPLSASTVTVVSASGSDTTQKVRISGIVSGLEDTEVLTLNGTTNVTSSKSFSEIRQVSKDGVTSGVVTVISNDASTTEILKIPAYALAKQYQPILLATTPSTVNSYKVKGYRRPKQLVNAEDFPELPDGFHDLVLIRATIIGHRDLLRPTMANEVLKNEYQPKIQLLRSQMGHRSVKESPVMGERSYNHTIYSQIPTYVG